MRLAIIGAGISGLSCADVLSKAGVDVTVFDKGRGVGGRMSTRRIETHWGAVSFDHGAQYFTARTRLFEAEVETWATLGHATRWQSAGCEAWIGYPSMTAPLKHIAQRHSIELGCNILGLVRFEKTWWLQSEAGRHGPYDAVVVALPPEQAASLLSVHDLLMARDAIEARSQPCWTLMVSFEDRLDIASDVLRNCGAIAWACRNNTKPGREGPEAWVVQASATWSANNISVDSDSVALLLLDALLAARASRQRASVSSLTAHRWRYARAPGLGHGALWNDTIAMGACGEWMLGPRVECAWLSGRMLARRIVQSLSG